MLLRFHRLDNMKIITFLIVLMFIFFHANGQNLVGYRDIEIRKYMKENRKDMNFENARNNKFNYLKYSDNAGSNTILFFLTQDSVCKSIRVICEASMNAEKVKEFDSIYKKAGENKWIDMREGKNYLVEIKDEKWSCIVTIEPDK